MDPARIAQNMLARSGSGACEANAITVIHTRAQRWEKEVRTKALARREAYPPAKSDAPQRKTAVTAYAAGANWGS